MKYEISEEIVNGLISYLAQRPYAEVAEGIKALSTLTKIEEL